MHYSGAHVFAWMSLLVGSGTLIAAVGTDFWSTHRPLESVDVISMHRGLWKQCTRYLLDTRCVNRFSRLADDVREVMRLGAGVFDGNRTPISNKKLQVFEWVILALMLMSIGLSVVSLLCSPCCCNHCSCCLSFWVFFAGICSACACIWYAYQNQIGETLTFSVQQPDDLPLYRMGETMVYVECSKYHKRLRVYVAEKSEDNILGKNWIDTLGGLRTFGSLHNQLAWSFYLAVCGSVCQVLAGVFFACSKSRHSSYSHSL